MQHLPVWIQTPDLHPGSYPECHKWLEPPPWLQKRSWLCVFFCVFFFDLSKGVWHSSSLQHPFKPWNGSQTTPLVTSRGLFWVVPAPPKSRSFLGFLRGPSILGPLVFLLCMDPLTAVPLTAPTLTSSLMISYCATQSAIKIITIFSLQSVTEFICWPPAEPQQD